MSHKCAYKLSRRWRQFQIQVPLSIYGLIEMEIEPQYRIGQRNHHLDEPAYLPVPSVPAPYPTILRVGPSIPFFFTGLILIVPKLCWNTLESTETLLEHISMYSKVGTHSACRNLFFCFRNPIVHFYRRMCNKILYQVCVKSEQGD